MIFKILKVLLTPVRWFLSAWIQLYGVLFPPSQLVSRDAAKQALIDEETRGLVLYHFERCPFCVKVRRHIVGLGLKIELRDVKRSAEFERELVAGGGEIQVPCLRINTPEGGYRWMYESSDINEYLSQRFAG